MTATMTEAQKGAVNLGTKLRDIARNFDDGTIAGKDYTKQLQDLATQAYNLTKLKAASDSLQQFGKSVSDWAINIRATQVGSTKSQLDTAREKFNYQNAALTAASGGQANTYTTTGITDPIVKKVMDTFIAQQNTANVGLDNSTIKNNLLGSITGNADQLIAAIKNFYGSSKQGVDLTNEVIDKVSALPAALSIQEQMLAVLGKIETNTTALPTYAGISTGATSGINSIAESINQATADLIAGVDAATTKAATQSLNANATIMLSLTSASAAANATNTPFLNSLMESYNAGTGLAIDAVINSRLDEVTKTSAVTALTNSFSAISASISSLNVKSSPNDIARVQDQINAYYNLTAAVKADIIALKGLTPGDATYAPLLAKLNTDAAALQGLSVNIANAKLSESAYTAINTDMANHTPPTISVDAKLTDNAKSTVDVMKEFTADKNPTVTMTVNANVTGLDNLTTYSTALNTFNGQLYAANQLMVGMNTTGINLSVSGLSGGSVNTGATVTAGGSTGSTGTGFGGSGTSVSVGTNPSGVIVATPPSSNPAADAAAAAAKLANASLATRLSGSTTNLATQAQALEQYLSMDETKVSSLEKLGSGVAMRALAKASSADMQGITLSSDVQKLVTAQQASLSSAQKIGTATSSKNTTKTAAELAQEKLANDIKTVLKGMPSPVASSMGVVLEANDASASFKKGLLGQVTAAELSSAAKLLFTTTSKVKMDGSPNSSAYLNSMSWLQTYVETHPVPSDPKEPTYKPYKYAEETYARLVDKYGEIPTDFYNSKAATGADKERLPATVDSLGKPLTAATQTKANSDYATAEQSLIQGKVSPAANAISSKVIDAYNLLIGWNEGDNRSDLQFATGGAFTNGIVQRPTSFNMGLMGEAGSEAIMPLTNINGKLGVHVIQSANDSNMNSEEELAELKRQNQLLIAQNAILQEGFSQLISVNKSQNNHLDDLSSTTRKQVNN
jgi:cell shape-determining protein MreC